MAQEAPLALARGRNTDCTGSNRCPTHLLFAAFHTTPARIYNGTPRKYEGPARTPNTTPVCLLVVVASSASLRLPLEMFMQIALHIEQDRAQRLLQVFGGAGSSVDQPPRDKVPERGFDVFLRRNTLLPVIGCAKRPIRHDPVLRHVFAKARDDERRQVAFVIRLSLRPITGRSRRKDANSIDDVPSRLSSLHLS